MKQGPYRGATNISRHSKHLFAIAIPPPRTCAPLSLFYTKITFFYVTENSDCTIKLISSSICVVKICGGKCGALVVSGDGIQMYD